MMTSNIFLNTRWLTRHLADIIKRAGERYTPELNVESPIVEVFYGLTKSPKFYYSIRAHLGKLIRAQKRIGRERSDDEIDRHYRCLFTSLSQLVNLLAGLKEYDTCTIYWTNIRENAANAQNTAIKLVEEIRGIRDKKNALSEKNEEKKQRDKISDYESDMHYLYELIRELYFFLELSSSPQSTLSNCPLLLLTGAAGIGKTHLLCDIAKTRIEDNYPTVVLFGELFRGRKNLWKGIITQLKIRRQIKDKDTLLKTLNEAGRKSQNRVLIAIDALNESDTGFWKKNMKELLAEVQKYPHLALVVSIRNGYAKRILDKEALNYFTIVEHFGFTKEIIWDAVRVFFKSYNVTLPEVPLLRPEFRYPLFLKFFCRKNRNSKPDLKGGNALKDIYEDFVIDIGLEVVRKFNPKAKKRDKGKNVLWDYIVKDTAAWMANRGEFLISQKSLNCIVRKYFSQKNTRKVIDLMEKRVLIHKVAVNRHNYYRFTYNKFSDHIIVRTLLASFTTKMQRIEAFTKRGRIGKMLRGFNFDYGILEALCIQTPEFCDKKEVFELAPHIADQYNLPDAFKESIIWRDSRSITNKAISIIKNDIKNGRSFFLDPILSLSSFPEHPLNANFLHDILKDFSLAERDAWWLPYLHYQYGEQGALDRLVTWAWSDEDKTHVSDEVMHLISVTLCWFLASSNRYVRDRSTKALVALLTDRIGIVTKLLRQFKDINDPYISERIYAVAYGCTLRNHRDRLHLNELSQWIFDNVFGNGAPPIHILLRDYARGVIEVALHRGIIDVDRKKIEPPYGSQWPDYIPTKEELKKKFYPDDFFNQKTKDRGFLAVWSSVMEFGDFARYIIGTNSESSFQWSSRRLNEPRKPTRKEIFNQFVNNLKEKQRQLWDKVHPKVDAALIKKWLESKGDDSTDETKGIIEEEEKAREALIKSFDDDQIKIYNEMIVPYLSSRSTVECQFDLSVAQRWIFQRVVELGWRPELHGEFDFSVSRYQVSRTEHKAERIGKKYQWIAYHEFLGLVVDNYEFREDAITDVPGTYQGPWQLSIRDIDPSCILNDTRNSLDTPSIKKWAIGVAYDAYELNLTDKEWIAAKADLISPSKIIQVNDDAGSRWLVLEGFIEWEAETPPEHEKYDLPTRQLFYIIKSYIVKKKDVDKVLNWIRKLNIFSGVLPESHDFYDIYLGEYPWAPAFLHHYTPYYNHDDWTDDAGSTKIPSKVLVTDDTYVSSGSNIDCSTENAIRVRLPAKRLVDEMGLYQRHTDGRFYSQDDNLVVFYPCLTNHEYPRVLLINRESLRDFMDSGGYAILWIVRGEKNIIGGGYPPRWVGRLRIGGTLKFIKNNITIDVFSSRLQK